MSCFTPIRGRMMRATRVDGCGRPVCGPCSQVVSKGFVSIAMSPQVDEGQAINVTNASGETCVNEPACPTMTGIQVTINFCQVDTDLFSFITGRDPIVDDQGVNRGTRFADILCTAGFALEAWTGVAREEGCDGAQGEAEFGYFPLPWLTGARLGDWTVENGAVTFSIVATARKGSAWGVGPYDVMDWAGGVPGRLFEPIAPDEFGQLLLTRIPPPEAECGCQPLTGCDTTIVSITADPAETTLVVTATDQITTLAVQQDGGVQDVTDEATYTTSDPAVATVDANGLVTAVGPGTATITVSYQGFTDTVTVTVNP